MSGRVVFAGDRVTGSLVAGRQDSEEGFDVETVTGERDDVVDLDPDEAPRTVPRTAPSPTHQMTLRVYTWCPHEGVRIDHNSPSPGGI